MSDYRERSRRTEGTTNYEYFRSNQYQEPVVQAAADLAVTATSADLSTLKKYLKNENSEIRYWGATGLLLLGEKALAAIDALQNLTDDDSYDVRTVVAEALYHLGEKEIALEVLKRVIIEGNQMEQVHVLNALDYMGDGERLKDAVAGIVAGSGEPHGYNWRAAKNLLLKWGE